MCQLNQNICKHLLPNLLEIQRISFGWFLEWGLFTELENFAVICDDLNELELSLSAKHYKIRRPKYSLTEAKRWEKTYSVRVYVRVKLNSLRTFESEKEEIFLGDIPLMTNAGTFIINGIERIIINQIVRSPGIYYTRRIRKNSYIYNANIISNNGSWIKFEIDKNELITIKIAKTKKISAYVFLKALGLEDFEIFQKLSKRDFFRKTVKGTKIFDTREALLEIHSKLCPEESPTAKGGKDSLYATLFDPKRYDLGFLGRQQINNKLNLDVAENIGILINKDFLAIINELIDFRMTLKLEDDIDHFGNRRIRSIGELLQNQVCIGLNRLERVVRERMNICEPKYLKTKTLISSKPLVASIREFFCSNPLSQFMDQTNPLAELTHKRRLSVLGPGGIPTDQAGLAIRDIHPSQYGRVCPIETPEGPNAGLIGSLPIYARINSYGFIETPFYPVKNGLVLKHRFPIYLNAFEEDKYYIAAGDLLINEKNAIQGSQIPVRYQQEFLIVPPQKVEYIAVSPLQIVSLAAALIPFLEHNDANRALMGSNMQRQSAPLLYPEAPIIGTGLEGQAARDSGTNILSIHSGKVVVMNTERICVSDKYNNTIEYVFNKYQKSNQGTCLNQTSLVSVNEKVIAGQVLADGTSMQGGELAVGQNIIIAYLPWEGYNFEDAFVINERLLYDDLFTSLHIEKFVIDVGTTVRGLEKVTRELPNIDENLVRNLDENGIITIGTWIKAGDILVGKTMYRDESEFSPEENLLNAIFKRKPPYVRNISFKVPHGTWGRVLDVKIISKGNKYMASGDTIKSIKIYIGQARKIQIGDKMAGRHGNKGVVSKILPRQDMPFLPDGTPVDILLNPLGIPSRMNVGQIFECLLGLAAEQLDVRFKIVPFDEMYGVEASRAFVNNKLLLASKKRSWLFSKQHPGKVMLRDGLTGKEFDNPTTVGKAYMLKLVHLVEDKIQARSTGPYSLVTQQPLGGRAQHGGQRFGEMEVWALEAFGAAHTLQELLTIKSDDIEGRNKTLYSIIKGEPLPKPGTPESFKVLVRELQALSLDITAYKTNSWNDMGLNDTEINLIE